MGRADRSRPAALLDWLKGLESRGETTTPREIADRFDYALPPRKLLDEWIAAGLIGSKVVVRRSCSRPLPDDDPELTDAEIAEIEARSAVVRAEVRAERQRAMRGKRPTDRRPSGWADYAEVRVRRVLDLDPTEYLERSFP